jgi:DNA repair protein RadA/Sms
VAEIEDADHHRLALSSAEMNRVLGGGLVRGSMVLLGGEPGIGKSTLSLQVALATKGIKTLYVSGEESASQIKMRALRLGVANDECYIYPETLLENILGQVEATKPDLVVIDSIQTIFSEVIESSAGSVSQIRECAARLLKMAKESGTSVIIIGHITKDGTIAGPKILEHIVDVVLSFEGDNNNVYRILRGIKNRFGATFEIGVFEMREEGLGEVENPSEILLGHQEEPLSGVGVGAAVDGIRPYLIEVQALVSNAAYGTPQRSATGFDNRRLNMLLAVLEKRVGLRMYDQDVYINIAGGMSLTEPAADLALCAAVASSHRNRSIAGNWAVMGEVGLAGEVRAIGQAERRIAECARLGFDRVILPKYNLRNIRVPDGLQAVGVETVAQMVVELGLHRS